MRFYVFYLSDIAVNVYEKKSLSTIEKTLLNTRGFRKMPYEAQAENEEEAIDLMLGHFRENISALKAFTKDTCIPAVILSLLL